MLLRCACAALVHLLITFLITFLLPSITLTHHLLICVSFGPMFRLISKGRSASSFRLSCGAFRRTLCASPQKEALSVGKDSTSEDTKAVDIFMTAMRVLVVLGVLSSMSSNRRVMEEAQMNDKVSTDLERTIENATETILKEEWRQEVKENIEKGDQYALIRGLNELLVVTSSDEDDQE